MSLALLAVAVVALTMALVHVLTQQSGRFAELGVTHQDGTTLLTVANHDDGVRAYTAELEVAGRTVSTRRLVMRPNANITAPLRALPSNQPVRVNLLTPGPHRTVRFTPRDLNR
jgi:hypothetical protein